jgi:hypothetical protein
MGKIMYAYTGEPDESGREFRRWLALEYLGKWYEKPELVLEEMEAGHTIHTVFGRWWIEREEK